MTAFILAALLGLSGDKPAAPPVPLVPSDKWVVDYQTNACMASRKFGSEPNTLTLAIEPAAAGGFDGTLYLLTTNNYGKSVRRGTATIRATPGDAVSTPLFMTWRISDTVRGWEIGGEPGSLGALGDATALTITMGRDRFALQTGKLNPVMKALAACNDDLMRGWGIDPTARAAPISNPGGWFTDNDYPAAARSAGAAGRVTIVMTVNDQGLATACRVVIGTRNADLDNATCDLAKRRGRFEKATGKSDRYSVLSIRWVM